MKDSFFQKPPAPPAAGVPRLTPEPVRPAKKELHDKLVQRSVLWGLAGVVAAIIAAGIGGRAAREPQPVFEGGTGPWSLSVTLHRPATPSELLESARLIMSNSACGKGIGPLVWA